MNEMFSPLFISLFIYYMKLLTKELQTELEKAFETKDDGSNPIALARFFNAEGAGTWYAMDYNKEDEVFFGVAEITEPEFGYFSKQELEEYRGRFGLGIERDLYFKPTPIFDIYPRMKPDR